MGSLVAIMRRGRVVVCKHFRLQFGWDGYLLAVLAISHCFLEGTFSLRGLESFGHHPYSRLRFAAISLRHLDIGLKHLLDPHKLNPLWLLVNSGHTLAFTQLWYNSGCPQRVDFFMTVLLVVLCRWYAHLTAIGRVSAWVSPKHRLFSNESLVWFLYFK